MQMAMKSLEPNALLVSIPQAAERLNTTTNAVRHLLWRGELGLVRLGKRHMIPASELSRWVERNVEHHGLQ
jgi:excisionase family DNA binding protein